MSYLLNLWFLVAFLLIATILFRVPQIGSSNAGQVSSENKKLDQFATILVFLFFVLAILSDAQAK